jgi:hypothetical protein
MIRVVVPAVLTLLVVAGFVGASGCNRSGDPRLTITLTERELALPWTTAPAPEDDPGLRLEILVDRRNDPLDARNWLTEDRMRAVGFVLNVPAGAPEAEETYRRLHPRIAWVAFEYGGSTWVEIERRRALRLEKEPYRPVMEQSRLVPVDAAADFDSLRGRYPSGHLILRAVIGIGFRGPNEGGPLLYGFVRELVPTAVTVPRHLRPVLDGLTRLGATAPPGAQPHAPVGPRYEADLAIGQLGIPYVRGIRRLGP